MTDVGWESTTWEGNRRRQHEEFMALSLRAKLKEIERLSEVQASLEAARAKAGAVGLPNVRTPGPSGS